MKKRSGLPFANWAVLAVVCAAGDGSSKTYTVLSTNDTGRGSLRQAITDANNHAGPDEIRFNIPSSDPGFDGSVWRILPQTVLPALTDGWTVIDGTSQASNQGDTNPAGPEIVLSGEEAGASSAGILLTSPNNTLRGLTVSGFPEAGISIFLPQAVDNAILGNYIGTRPAGDEPAGNGDGIRIVLGAKRNTVGGPKPGEGNVISGNLDSGVYINDADSNRVIGNYIGTNAAGDEPLSNKYGVLILTGANGNTIGGTRRGDCNVISGNRNSNVFMADADWNVVVGNFIGTDAAGNRPIGGEGHGVTLEAASNSRVGGQTAEESNLISGNGQCGIRIRSSGADGNQVVGNRIGTDQTGALPVPNLSDGVAVFGGARRTQIGPSNVIRYNLGNGIGIYDAETIENRITRNSISNNEGMGILLLSGANGGMAAPVVSWGASGLQGSTVPNGTVEVFSDESSQGLVYEGTSAADDEGRFSWTGTPAGPHITATATDPGGSTSGFSAPIGATGLWHENHPDPPGFALNRNYPNPFNPSTRIPFSLGSACRVRLVVTDISGREVAVAADAVFPAGRSEVRFDASGLPAGVYVVRLEAGGARASARMAVVK